MHIKEFLIDQCVVPEQYRSLKTNCSVVSKRIITFDGQSNNPLTWNSGLADIKLVSINNSGARVVDVTQQLSQALDLTIADNCKEIVKEYTDYYLEALLSSSDVEFIEQSDTGYIIANGDMTTTIEFENDVSVSSNTLERGIWDEIKKGVRKAVSTVVTKVKNAFTNHPVVSTVAVACTVVGIAVSAGIITLPAGLGIAGTGLVGSISYTFFL